MELRERKPGLCSRRCRINAQGSSTTLTHPSSFFMKVTYISGACSNDTRWVTRSSTPRGSDESSTRQQVVAPTMQDALAHAKGDLLVEHRHERRRVGSAGVHVPGTRRSSTLTVPVDCGRECSRDFDRVRHRPPGQAVDSVAVKPRAVPRPSREHPANISGPLPRVESLGDRPAEPPRAAALKVGRRVARPREGARSRVRGRLLDGSVRRRSGRDSSH